MTSAALTIRPLVVEDIEKVAGFPPRSWGSDLPGLLRRQLGQPYFFPFVGVADGAVVAVAHGIQHVGVAWLGNIIVANEARGRGHGTAITRHLVDFFYRRGVRTQLLIATEMGRPVYTKIGFEVTGNYRFYRGLSKGAKRCEYLGPIEEADRQRVLALDRLACGEDRRPFTSRLLEGGLLYDDGIGTGFYLPEFGAGLVVATNPTAGCALLEARGGEGSSVVVVPEGNQMACRLLEDRGFERFLDAPRMALGPEVAWKPEWIYSRGAGYCG